MIHHYHVTSEAEETFALDFEIQADATFAQLMDLLIDTLDFDPASIGMFYLCDDRWEEIGQVASSDFFETDAGNQYDIESSSLEDLLDETGARMRYLFDLFEDRYLRLQLVKIHSGSLSSPQIISLEGKKPRQTNPEEFVGNLLGGDALSSDVPLGMMDEAFGEELFNADELSSDGFSIVDEE